MSYGRTEKTKRLRGQILELLRARHDSRQSRMDSTELWSALVRGLAFDVSKDEVTTMCEDLESRGYIRFELNQRLYDQRGERLYMRIELCPKGRDVLEGTLPDPAVEI